MLTGQALWRQARRPLIGVVVLSGIAVLAAPLAASVLIDVSRWNQIAEAPARNAIWIDPDWREMPYTHWRLRGANWQQERIVVPGTGEVITVRTATDAGREFWTVSTAAAAR